MDPTNVEVDIGESKEVNLDQLIDELVQIFFIFFDKIDKTLAAQKEEIIQRILKLGGNNYTCEDLKKDILDIELEDIYSNQS